ncbi:MAG: DUF3422 domain-containing protein [Candidatus Competibacteraceae bacterium]
MSASTTTEPAPLLASLGLREHPLRDELDQEFHARPFERLETPRSISHLALLSGPGREAIDRDRAHVARLCARFGAPPPAPSAVHLSVDCGSFRLKWERHSEFSAYTFIGPASTEQAPFAAPAIELPPPDWLAELFGELLVATHLALRGEPNPAPTLENLRGLFDTPDINGCRAADDAATVWSDFRVASDGFTRILVLDRGLRATQAGRLVQRLLNIETYRLTAMLAFPLARRVGTEITRIENRLTVLAGGINLAAGLERDRALLAELSELAAEMERLTASTTYRFGASRAYYALVERRIAELREHRLPSVQTLREFTDRRLAPAMRTVEAVRERQDSLSGRIARAANLLRTRVDVALEHQNRDLLHSMDRRAHLQLRLQETVEGLSVVVLSYYLVGLVSYAAKALSKLGLPLNPDLVAGLAIPVAMVTVGFGIRRLRHHLAHGEGA